jgi:hypothetical protein
MMEDDLEESFVAEFDELVKRTNRFVFSVTPLEAWALLGHVQLACRHPGNNGVTREIAVRIARQFQQMIASEGTLAIIAERGWHREYDQ